MRYGKAAGKSVKSAMHREEFGNFAGAKEINEAK
jgi:hypothetical protein